MYRTQFRTETTTTRNRRIEQEEMHRIPPAVDPRSSSACRRCADGHCPGFIQHRTWRDVCRRCRCDRHWHVDFSDPENHIYENPSDYASVAYSTMSTLSSEGCDHGNNATDNLFGNQTLSSVDEDSSFLGSRKCCLSPSTKLRLAADAQRQSTSDDDSGCALEEYVWIPSGLRPDLVHQYFNSLPDDKVAYVNSPGEKWRLNQLLVQLPPQDTEARYCRHLSPSEQNELKTFAQQRKREALGRGVVKIIPYSMEGNSCAQCSQQVYAGDLGVFSSRAGDQTVWHPACFVCRTCNELLVDLLYFYKDHNVYCGRHHAELLKPRCGACDEIIFAEECTEAESRSWHVHHFTCFECDKSLGGTRYVMRDDRPYCLECFRKLFAESCVSCKQTIANDEARMTHGNRQWHATNYCFVCTTCRAGLLGQPFLPRDDGIFCSVKCATKKFPCNNELTNKKIRSHSAASRSRKVKTDSSTLKSVDCRSDDESDYESISPRLQRINGHRSSLKQQTKSRKYSVNHELMARSVVDEATLTEMQNISLHRSLPDLVDSQLNISLETPRSDCRQSRKRNDAKNGNYVSQHGVVTKLIEKKETTFGVAERNSSNVRTVRFSSNLGRSSNDIDAGCSRGDEYCSSCSSSSSDDDDDDEGFSYYTVSSKLQQQQKRERVKYVESKQQSLNTRLQSPNTPKTQKRNRSKANNNCIVS